MVANKKLNIVDKKKVRGGLSGYNNRANRSKRYKQAYLQLNRANSKLEMETIKPEEWKLETTSREEKPSQGGWAKE